MRGAVIDVKRRRRYWNGDLHVALDILPIASPNWVPFWIAWLMCSRYFNSLSKMTSRYFASLDGVIVVPSMLTAASVLMLRFRVKWIRIYFDLSNYASCFFFQSSVLISSSSNLSAFPFAVSPSTPYPMSSMNPSAICFVGEISRRSAL